MWQIVYGLSAIIYSICICVIVFLIVHNGIMRIIKEVQYALELFLDKYDESAKVFAIEAEDIVSHIKCSEEIGFSYPVQYSNIPNRKWYNLERTNPSRIFKDAGCDTERFVLCV